MNRRLYISAACLVLIKLVVVVEVQGFAPSSSASFSWRCCPSTTTTTSTTTTINRHSPFSRRLDDHNDKRCYQEASPSPKILQSTLSPVAVLFCGALLRGGAANAATQVALNMSRENLKLASMATYSTITALIMNASLRLYTSQKFAKNKSTQQARLVENAFTGLTILCIISGVFTAVLFNILGIYSKECLGLANDVGYVHFQDATALYRKYGFRCFLTTCVSFLGSFLLSASEKTADEDRKGQAILVVSIILTVLGAYHIKRVLDLATKFVYTPEICTLNHIAKLT